MNSLLFPPLPPQKFADTLSTFSSKDLKYNDPQKTVVITGPKIRLDDVGLSISSQKSGVSAIGMITAQDPTGKEIILAEWGVSKTSYQKRSKAVNQVFEEKLTLRWYLATTNPDSKAFMKLCNYTYTLPSRL